MPPKMQGAWQEVTERAVSSDAVSVELLAALHHTPAHRALMISNKLRIKLLTLLRKLDI